MLTYFGRLEAWSLVWITHNAPALRATTLGLTTRADNLVPWRRVSLLEKHHDGREREPLSGIVSRRTGLTVRVQELCEQGGGPGLSFPIPFFPRPCDKPYGFCRRKAP